MNYLYLQQLDNEKDLKHIEWFVEHLDEYNTPHKKEAQYLKDHITNKNLYYSELKRNYYIIVNDFDNNPYNYKYDVYKHDKGTSAKLNDYFVSVNQEKVAYQYCIDTYGNDRVGKDSFDKLKKESQRIVREELLAVNRRFSEYKEMVLPYYNAYSKVGNGSYFNFLKLFIYFGIYVALCTILINTTCLKQIIVYSFSQAVVIKQTIQMYFCDSHFILCALILIATIYFVIKGALLCYNLYYLFYIDRKYHKAMKDYEYIGNLNDLLVDDYYQAKEELEGTIEKVHHTSQYLELIDRCSVYYEFKGRPLFNKDDSSNYFQEPKAPKANFNDYYLLKMDIILAIVVVLAMALRFYV